MLDIVALAVCLDSYQAKLLLRNNAPQRLVEHLLILDVCIVHNHDRLSLYCLHRTQECQIARLLLLLLHSQNVLSRDGSTRRQTRCCDSSRGIRHFRLALGLVALDIDLLLHLSCILRSRLLYRLLRQGGLLGLGGLLRQGGLLRLGGLLGQGCLLGSP